MAGRTAALETDPAIPELDLTPPFGPLTDVRRMTEGSVALGYSDSGRSVLPMTREGFRAIVQHSSAGRGLAFSAIARVLDDSVRSLDELQTTQGRDRTMHAGPFKNAILQHLEPAILARLKLRLVQLPLEYDLETPGKPIEQIFFVEEGIGSMTTSFQGGAQVETSMFGFESAVGVSALMGTKHSLNRIFMQLAGYGMRRPSGPRGKNFSAVAGFSRSRCAMFRRSSRYPRRMQPATRCTRMSSDWRAGC